MDALKQVGSLVSAHGSLLEGEAAQNAARFRAAQLEQNAGQEIASSQRASEESLRQSRLMASRALAVAGASGGGALDGSVLRAIGGIHAEGTLASLTNLYEGETKAAALRRGASAALYEGEQAVSASKIRATTTILNSASDFKGAFDSFESDSSPSFGSGEKPDYSLARSKTSSSIGLKYK